MFGLIFTWFKAIVILVVIIVMYPVIQPIIQNLVNGNYGSFTELIVQSFVFFMVFFTIVLLYTGTQTT